MIFLYQAKDDREDKCEMEPGKVEQIAKKIEEHMKDPNQTKTKAKSRLEGYMKSRGGGAVEGQRTQRQRRSSSKGDNIGI